MAIVYAVVGWTLVQVADAVFPALDLPDWSVTLVVALVLLGFPLALVLAWAFERTPAGVQRAAAAPGRRVVAAFVLGLAAFGLLAFALAGDRVDGAGASRTYSSIAVLPFEDLSPDDQSYFSEGIAEELMTVLATVPELDVVGRASAFAFRDRTASLDEIGRQLGVDVILDGSVRRDGDALRIAVQLIDVGDSRVVWSHRYDRRAGDIFALQDEIAAAVAGEVEIRLSLPPPPEADSARLRAYTLYLQGLAAWHRRTARDLEEAARLFRRAVEADSTYAPAHAGIALTHALLPLFVPELEADHAAIVEREAHRALVLDSTLAEAHAALSQRAMVLTWDRQTAVAEAKRAIELRPSYATGWQWYAEALLSQQRTGEALEAIDRAIELDPLAPAPRNIRGAILYASGDLAAGLEAVRAGKQRFPEVRLFDDALLTTGLCTADTALMREGAAGYDPPIPDEVINTAVAAVRAPAGSEERRQRLEELAAFAPPGRWMTPALLTAALGETDMALREIETTVAARNDPTLLYFLGFPCFDSLRDEPRYRAAMDRLP